MKATPRPARLADQDDARKAPGHVLTYTESPSKMPVDADPGQKLDRSVITVSDRFDDDEVRLYWHSRTPAERLAHVEILRRINFGYRATERILRVIEIVNVAD